MSATLWLLLALSSCVGVQSGNALLYGPGVMTRVYHVREKQGLVPYGWQGAMGAAIECSDIGSVWQASFYNPRAETWTGYEPVLIVDCAQYRDRAAHYARNVPLEADWATAVRDGWSRDGKTKVGIIKTGR